MFVLNYVQLLYYECYKINPNFSGSYIDFPDWIKSINATINLTNKKDNKCFPYAITAALNQEDIKNFHKEKQKLNPSQININRKD